LALITSVPLLLGAHLDRRVAAPQGACGCWGWSTHS
jgi:hypothetical protein